MWPSNLDMHTLHVEHAVLLGAFTILTTGNSLLHRGEGGARWFPVFTFAAFLGAVLISLRGSLSDTLSMVIGAALFPVAYVFLHLSLSEFFNQRARGWQLQLFFVCASAATLLRWGIFSPNTGVRVAIYSALLTLQLGFTTVFVLRHVVRIAGPVRWAGSMMAGVLALLFLNNLIRAVVLVLHGAPANYLQGSRQLGWALLMTSVLQGATAVAFVWMTAARLQHELCLEATTDPLTRLLNRRAIATWAEREIRRSQDNGWPLSAILIDLDEFKSINDAWGHHLGDCVLLEVARVLSTSVRPGDQIARLGGDEFVVLLPSTPEEVARDLAERLRVEITGIRCATDGDIINVRASFGVAELGGLGLTWDELVQRCDKALYLVKGMGGNRTLAH